MFLDASSLNRCEVSDGLLHSRHLARESASGWATLTLMEKMVNVTGSHPVGNYAV
jgi:hypothetical protein